MPAEEGEIARSRCSAVMKISNTIRITKPVARNDHNPAVRVNFTADSGGGSGSGVDAGGTGGTSGDTDGSLLMVSSLPFYGPK